MIDIKEGGAIDFLSFVHVITYLVIGIFVKDQYVLAFVIGVIWEIVEYMMVNNPRIRKLIIDYYPIRIEKWEDKYNKFFDLVFNMIGYYIGNKYFK